MAYFNNAFYKTFVVNEGIVTAGTSTATIPKGQLALVTDAEWKTVAPATVLPANTLAYLVQGSLYASDTIGNNPGHGGYKESVKSKGINPRYISRVWEQDATVASQATAKICVASDCAPCGQNLFLRMDVKGSPALRFLNHNAYAIGDSSGDAACNGASLPGLCCVGTQTHLDPALALAASVQMLLCDPLMKPFAAEGSSAVTGVGMVSGAATTGTLVNGTYTGVASTVAPAGGTGATFTIVVAGGSITSVTTVAVGAGYAVADVITVDGALVGGVTTTDDITFDVDNIVGNGLGMEVTSTTGATVVVAYYSFAQILDGTSYTPSVDPTGSTTVSACATLVGAYVDTKFGNCSFDTRDHYNAEPVQLILSVLDETGDPCNDCGVATMTPGSMQQTQGEEVIRALILSERYRQSPYNQGNADSARIREIEMSDDLLGFVDRSATYKAYYVQHVVPRFNNPSGVYDNDQYVCQIFVKDADTAGKTKVETILDGLITMANAAGQNIAMETYTL